MSIEFDHRERLVVWKMSAEDAVSLADFIEFHLEPSDIGLKDAERLREAALERLRR